MNDEIVPIIKQWLKIENELKLLSLEAKKRKQEKKDLTNQLMNVMKTNELDCIDTSNGKIVYTKSETKKPINKKTLEEILKKYYSKDDDAEKVCNFILENRETKVNENIKLKQNKKD